MFSVNVNIVKLCSGQICVRYSVPPPLQDGPDLRQPGGDLGVPRGHSAAAAGELPPQPHPHRQDLPGVLPAPHQDVLQVSGKPGVPNVYNVGLLPAAYYRLFFRLETLPRY